MYKDDIEDIFTNQQHRFLSSAPHNPWYNFTTVCTTGRYWNKPRWKMKYDGKVDKEK